MSITIDIKRSATFALDLGAKYGTRTVTVTERRKGEGIPGAHFNTIFFVVTLMDEQGIEHQLKESEIKRTLERMRPRGEYGKDPTLQPGEYVATMTAGVKEPGRNRFKPGQGPKDVYGYVVKTFKNHFTLRDEAGEIHKCDSVPGRTRPEIIKAAFAYSSLRLAFDHEASELRAKHGERWMFSDDIANPRRESVHQRTDELFSAYPTITPEERKAITDF